MRVAGLVLVDIVPNLDPDRVRRFLAARGLLDGYAEFVEDNLAQLPRLRQITAELDLPILLVRGGRSGITDDMVDQWLRLAPQSTVTRISDAGHLVARDQPVELAKTIAAVTNGWPAPASRHDLGT